VRLPPKKKSSVEGQLAVQWFDEDGHASVGFAKDEAELRAKTIPSREGCCRHCPEDEPHSAYVVLGRVVRGYVVDDAGKRTRLGDVIPGNWID